MYFKIKKNQRGFTLIECIVGLVMLAIASSMLFTYIYSGRYTIGSVSGSAIDSIQSSSDLNNVAGLIRANYEFLLAEDAKEPPVDQEYQLPVIKSYIEGLSDLSIYGCSDCSLVSATYITFKPDNIEKPDPDPTTSPEDLDILKIVISHPGTKENLIVMLIKKQEL